MDVVSNGCVMGQTTWIPYSVTPGFRELAPGPQDPSGEMAERIRIQEENALMEKWNTNDISEAKHIQAWLDNPTRFARDVVGYAATLGPDVLPGYIASIHKFIINHQIAVPPLVQFNLITDVGLVGQFGWLVFPEYKDYIWSRHIMWNTNDFIKNISITLMQTEDPAVYEEIKKSSLTLLDDWAAPGWKEKIPAGLKVDFLKAFFPQEIEAAAVATKIAADKAKFIGIAVVGIVAGGLLLSITGKKRPIRTIKKVGV